MDLRWKFGKMNFMHENVFGESFVVMEVKKEFWDLGPICRVVQATCQI